MSQLEQLEQQVIQWADEKGILSKATAYKQAQKTQEEVGELLYAIGKFDEAAKSESLDGMIEGQNDIRDAIGDSVVTLIIQAKMQGMTLTECLQAAYDVIKDRQGEMISGQFVREK